MKENILTSLYTNCHKV